MSSIILVTGNGFAAGLLCYVDVDEKASHKMSKLYSNQLY